MAVQHVFDNLDALSMLLPCRANVSLRRIIQLQTVFSTPCFISSTQLPKKLPVVGAFLSSVTFCSGMLPVDDTRSIFGAGTLLPFRIKCICCLLGASYTFVGSVYVDCDDGDIADL